MQDFNISKKPQRCYRCYSNILFFLLLIFILLNTACGKKTDLYYYELAPITEPDSSVIYKEKGIVTLEYHEFDTGSGDKEWILLSPKGFYDASVSGADFITVKTKNNSYSLAQFSELLYRPDLIKDQTSGAAIPDLAAILKELKPAPAIDASLTGDIINIKLTGKETDAGTVMLYYRDKTGQDSPAAMFDAKQLTEININDYIAANNNMAGLAVSVFNSDHTMESRRFFIPNPNIQTADTIQTAQTIQTAAAESIQSAALTNAEKPVLHLLLMTNVPEAIITALGRQKNGSLYSAVEIQNLFNNKNSDNEITQSSAGSLAGNPAAVPDFFTAASQSIAANDVYMLFLPGPCGTDAGGDYMFALSSTAQDNGAQEYYLNKWDLIENVLKLKPHNGVILIDGGDGTNSGGGGLIAGQASNTDQAGFARLQKMLGPDRIAAVMPQTAISEILGADGDQFISAADLADLSLIKNRYPAGSSGYKFNDFPILDRHIIEQAPAAAAANRGYVTQSLKDYLNWVASRDLEGDLPDFGVFLEELNPKNYQKIDAPVLLNMGMEQYYISFLAGNKFYEAGKYAEAIAEYGKSINLKADFADVYAWRGNAYRKLNNPGAAIDDYTMAIKYKNNYPEVYNYRGFTYAQTGDYDRAIADYSQAIKLKNSYTDALYNRAWAYSKKGDYDRAVTDYSQVIRLENNNADAYMERGRCWQAMGANSKAESDFKTAEKISGNLAVTG
ncbi:MAG: tetratricopeptide repeat protein [Treponema sp.]|nr:tetratricopeptide repeat protein [Treponema sp.]